jgi:hypothetical protein
VKKAPDNIDLQLQQKQLLEALKDVEVQIGQNVELVFLLGP